MTDEESEAVVADHRRHVANVRSLLPAGLQMLVEGGGHVYLHDGRFIHAQWKVGTTDVLLVDISCWDWQNKRLVGNVRDEMLLHVRLAYQGAVLVSPLWKTFAKLVFDPSTEILFGEVDIGAEGGFEHRMLLWPKDAGEVAIRFATVDVAVVRFVDGRVEVVVE
jgi:hypothetical protein